MKIQKSKTLLSWIALLCVASTSALSAQDAYLSDEDFYNEEVSQSVNVDDPLEFINRYTFQFNDFVYMNVLDPLASGYTAITPDPVEEGASNFFYNLKYPVRLVSNLLQGRLDGAWVETGRFAINTTIGIAGIMTPADDFEGFAPIKSEDIGQVLGAWGVSDGPYFVIPLLGPSNLRDAIGLVGDRAVNPLKEPFSAIDSWNWEWKLALSGSEFIATSPAILERYIQMKGSAIDPYSSLKNGYTQFRRAAIKE